jgi:hypothetical protein
MVGFNIVFVSMLKRRSQPGTSQLKNRPSNSLFPCPAVTNLRPGDGFSKAAVVERASNRAALAAP